MENLFLVSLFFIIFNTSGQVLFTKRPLPSIDNDKLQPDTAKQSALLVTYLGRPLNQLDQVTVGSKYRAGDFNEDELMGADTLEQLLRRLKFGIQSDSIGLYMLKERYLGAGTIGATVQHEARELPFANIPSVLPIRISSWRDYQLKSGFGMRFHPVLHRWSKHLGLDFPTPEGTDVFVTADGWVDRVNYDPDGLGLSVVVRHSSGYTTVYGHLSNRGVMPGQRVLRGDRIGRTGNTGLSTGPHLHYAVLDGSKPVNPLDFCFLLLHWKKNAALSETRKR